MTLCISFCSVVWRLWEEVAGTDRRQIIGAGSASALPYDAFGMIDASITTR